jgi:hypothetical protein
VTVRESAPICLFVHARPGHTRRTLDALAANALASESLLIARSDGPRGPGEAARVEAVRALLRKERRFRRVELHEQERNLGLARSVISGLDEVFQRFEAAIILEDDLVTSPHFLAHMNRGLERYRHDPRVGAIQGARLGTPDGTGASFFSRLFLPWGWGTWRRAWADFEPDARKLQARLREGGLQHAFNLEGSYNFYRMLREQQLGLVDSWFIRWYASQFLLGRLALWPGQGLVDDIGLDGSGTHARAGSARLRVGGPGQGGSLPEVREDPAQAAAIASFYRERSGGVLLGWLKYHCPIALKAALQGKLRRRP